MAAKGRLTWRHPAGAPRQFQARCFKFCGASAMYVMAFLSHFVGSTTWGNGLCDVEQKFWGSGADADFCS